MTIIRLETDRPIPVFNGQCSFKVIGSTSAEHLIFNRQAKNYQGRSRIIRVEVVEEGGGRYINYASDLIRIFCQQISDLFGN